MGESGKKQFDFLGGLDFRRIAFYRRQSARTHLRKINGDGFFFAVRPGFCAAVIGSPSNFRELLNVLVRCLDLPFWPTQPFSARYWFTTAAPAHATPPKNLTVWFWTPRVRQVRLLPSIRPGLICRGSPAVGVLSPRPGGQAVKVLMGATIYLLGRCFESEWESEDNRIIASPEQCYRFISFNCRAQSDSETLIRAVPTKIEGCWIVNQAYRRDKQAELEAWQRADHEGNNLPREAFTSKGFYIPPEARGLPIEPDTTEEALSHLLLPNAEVEPEKESGRFALNFRRSFGAPMVCEEILREEFGSDVKDPNSALQDFGFYFREEVPGLRAYKATFADGEILYLKDVPQCPMPTKATDHFRMKELQDTVEQLRKGKETQDTLQGADDHGNATHISKGQSPREICRKGKFEWRQDFNDVWVDGDHYDLRQRHLARLCLQYLAEKKVFDSQHALDFVADIDPYVRSLAGKPAKDRGTASRIADYFVGENINALRKALIRPGQKPGSYYLATGR